jgi:hypothetical protein
MPEPPEPELRTPQTESGISARTPKDSPPANEPSAALLLGIRFASVLETLIARVFSDTVIKWFLGAIVVLTLGLVWSLPPTERGSVVARLPAILDRIGKVIEPGFLAWAGWGVAGVLLAAGVPFMRQQHRRIKAQGDENRKLRELLDPQRLSSRSPKQLDLYETNARGRYK